MAATIDMRAGTEIPANMAGKSFVLDIKVDCSTDNVGSGDTVQLFNIKEGCYVQSVTVVPITAEGGTLTVDIGDYDSAGSVTDADGWIDGGDLNATTVLTSAPVLTTGSPCTVAPAHGLGKLYTADAIIAALFNNAADAAVFHVRVAGYRVFDDIA